MIALLSTDSKFDSKPYIEVIDGAERLFNGEFKKYGFWAFSNEHFRRAEQNGWI